MANAKALLRNPAVCHSAKFREQKNPLLFSFREGRTKTRCFCIPRRPGIRNTIKSNKIRWPSIWDHLGGALGANSSAFREALNDVFFLYIYIYIYIYISYLFPIHVLCAPTDFLCIPLDALHTIRYDEITYWSI